MDSYGGGDKVTLTCDAVSTLTAFWEAGLTAVSASLLSVSEVDFVLVSCSRVCGWQATQHQMVRGTSTNRVTTAMLPPTEPRMVARFDEQSLHSSALKTEQKSANVPRDWELRDVHGGSFLPRVNGRRDGTQLQNGGLACVGTRYNKHNEKNYRGF